MMGVPNLFLGIALGVAIVLAAIGTFLGNSAARYVLVALVMVHYGLVAYNNFAMASQGVEVRGGSAMLIGRGLRSIITAAVIAAYLVFSRKANAFFSQRGPST